MKKFANNYKRLVAVVAISLSVFTALAQVGIDRLVNAYSLITDTWATFNVTTLNAANLAIDGTTITAILSTNVTVDFASCGTNATVTVSQTITGITTNDVAIANFVSPHTSFTYNAAVTAADTITLSAANISITNAINQAAMPVRITVLRY